jgi:hypothetical protein
MSVGVCVCRLLVALECQHRTLTFWKQFYGDHEVCDALYNQTLLTESDYLCCCVPLSASACTDEEIKISVLNFGRSLKVIMRFGAPCVCFCVRLGNSAVFQQVQRGS